MLIGTNSQVTLKTPIIQLTKGQVVVKALELNAPIELTWSCYKGGDVQCGTCPTCNERKEAFKFAGVTDPVGYAN
tara:strand:- start:265 stop:489 length:225 start_codon:yes stop_codon:yes gene_type:complete